MLAVCPKGKIRKVYSSSIYTVLFTQALLSGDFKQYCICWYFETVFLVQTETVYLVQTIVYK